MSTHFLNLDRCSSTCSRWGSWTTVDYHGQDKNMIKKESLPDGLDFPSFPSLDLSKLITPIIFSQNSYLVYILQMPLLQSTPYQLYKLQPFPVEQQEKMFVYFEVTKEFIFTDAMRHKYGKMSYPELSTCLMPN